MHEREGSGIGRDGWDKVIDIDLKGVYLSSKLVISEMKKVGCGAIVNISSIGRLTGQSYAMAFQSAFDHHIQLKNIIKKEKR